MAYIVLYGNEKNGNQRKVIATVPNVKYDITRRVFDLGTGSIEGLNVYNKEIENAILYTLHEEDGTYIYAGFMKNLEQPDNTIKFNTVDLRTILDTDVFIDYSHGEQDKRLSSVFTKVFNYIIDKNTYNMTIVYDIEEDLTDTSAIADYTGRYLIVNALNFLKPYLSYYGYYISINYDQQNDTLTYSLDKSEEALIDIKLEDFVHTKTTNDIKVNKTVATIKFVTKEDNDEAWFQSDEVEFANAENKSIVYGLEPPSLENYPVGWHIKLIQNPAWVPATEQEYNNAINRLNGDIYKVIPGTNNRWVSSSYDPYRIYMPYDSPPTGTCTVNDRTGIIVTDPFSGSNQYYYCRAGSAPSCPPGPPSIDEINDDLKNQTYDVGTVARYNYRTNFETCKGYTYAKLVGSAMAYYKRTGLIIYPRPPLPEKTFTLGLDNNIYEGEAPLNLRIFPESKAIYEAEYLADAQFNAMYYLISNRWNENIILEDNRRTPLDIKTFSLFQMIRVFDKNQQIKILPVAEINLANEKYNVKLGFKKTSFTEIIKYDIGSNSSITKK